MLKHDPYAIKKYKWVTENAQILADGKNCRNQRLRPIRGWMTLSKRGWIHSTKMKGKGGTPSCPGKDGELMETKRKEKGISSSCPSVDVQGDLKCFLRKLHDRGSLRKGEKARDIGKGKGEQLHQKGREGVSRHQESAGEGYKNDPAKSENKDNSINAGGQGEVIRNGNGLAKASPSYKMEGSDR